MRARQGSHGYTRGSIEAGGAQFHSRTLRRRSGRVTGR